MWCAGSPSGPRRLGRTRGKVQLRRVPHGVRVRWGLPIVSERSVQHRGDPRRHCRIGADAVRDGSVALFELTRLRQGSGEAGAARWPHRAGDLMGIPRTDPQAATARTAGARQTRGAMRPARTRSERKMARRRSKPRRQGFATSAAAHPAAEVIVHGRPANPSRRGDRKARAGVPVFRASGRGAPGLTRPCRHEHAAHTDHEKVTSNTLTVDTVTQSLRYLRDPENLR